VAAGRAASSGSATSDLEETLFDTVGVRTGEHATEDPRAGFLFQRCKAPLPWHRARPVVADLAKTYIFRPRNHATQPSRSTTPFTLYVTPDEGRFRQGLAQVTISTYTNAPYYYYYYSPSGINPSINAFVRLTPVRLIPPQS
jgi:hypothetical protein